MSWKLGPEMKLKSCLVTGAAGIVGRQIRPWLAASHEHLLLTDMVEISELDTNESFLRGDITDETFVKQLCQQVDGVVHLAGLVGPQYTFAEVMQPNVIGTNNLFEAARLAGVQRFVFASSHHAIGFIRRGQPIDETTSPRPDSYYGMSKAFGESMASYFADKYGLDVLVIRIGYVGEQVVDERRLHTWTSARDLAQLIDIGLRTSDLGCQLVYGVSDNPAPFFDNRNAYRLGYRPQDRAVDFLADESLLRAEPDQTSPAGFFIGGHFVE
jgi:uronate dehydrogenase